MNPGKAGPSQDMACDEYLARHSEYLDGLLSPLAAARLNAHAAACGSCARYDRIVRKGIDLVRDLPDPVPSEDFELRLQHRIFHMEDARALQPHAAGATTALGVAAIIALLAWSPMLKVAGDHDMAAAPALELRTYDAFEPGPLFSQNAWYPMTMPAGPPHHSSAMLASFPGPYSPLVVAPPAHRSVRSVSAEYVSID